MRLPLKKILGVVLPMAVFLISSQAQAQEPSRTGQTAGAKGELSLPAPDLADIIPLATELTGRLAVLKNKVTDLLDVSGVEKKYTAVEANLKGPADQLQRLKVLKDYRLNKLVELREAIDQENESFERGSKPLNKAIRKLGSWRNEWLSEKKRWSEWQSSLLREEEPDRLKSTFEKVNDTIDLALDLILPQLEAMLTLQEKGGHIQTKINALANELDYLIVDERRGALLDSSPPMLSFQYFSQFRSSELWYATQQGLAAISWSGGRFLVRQGWIVFVQGFLSLFVIIALFRNRRALNESKRWRFLAMPPVSAGLFLGTITTVWFYFYWGAPATLELAISTIGGISFARLSASLVEASWKRQFVYGVMILFIVTGLLDLLNFPLPLFRLYMVLTALVGLLLCRRWAGECRRQSASGRYTGFLYLGVLFFVFIVIVEFWGRAALALYLLSSLLDSIATTLVFMLFIYMIHGGLEWLFRTSLIRRTQVLYGNHTDAIVRHIARFIGVAILGLVLLPAILMIWGVYDSLEGATKSLLALGFTFGSQRVSVGLLLISAGILYGAFLISWILQKLLMDEVLIRRRVEKGVRHSIGRLVHYVLILLGFLFALSVLGFEFTKITIVLSALGVGIGFGLQGIVNNFVSGLILLFERPVRVGDTIEIGGKWSEIKGIGIRSTIVQTLDQADVIIPNADLINSQVTNWTLTNRLVRLTIPIGVAYGSNVPLVMETLVACAQDHDMVAAFRPPQVLFLSFGESSLDFELRVWVKDADHRLKVKSDLHQEIDRKFREANIEIAFPQHDLHLRSVDESVRLRSPETTK